MNASRIAPQAASFSIAALITLILLAGLGSLADRQYVEAVQAALPASAQTALAVAPAKI